MCVCARVFVGMCVCQTDSERSSVYSKSRGSLPIAQNTKRSTPGGLLGNPSAHRERAEERLTYRKQAGGAHTQTHTSSTPVSYIKLPTYFRRREQHGRSATRGQNCKLELYVLLHRLKMKKIFVQHVSKLQGKAPYTPCCPADN